MFTAALLDPAYIMEGIQSTHTPKPTRRPILISVSQMHTCRRLFA